MARRVVVRAVEHLAVVLVSGTDSERTSALQKRVETLVGEAQQRTDLHKGS